MDLCRIYLIGFTIMITLTIIYLFSGKRSLGTRFSVFFSDILKDNDGGKMKWSQGRFYLFLSLMFYFFVLTLLSLKAMKPNIEIKNETFEMVISALQWVIALFAGYVFGAKGLRVLDSIFKYRVSKNNNPTEVVIQETQPTQKPIEQQAEPKEPEV